MEQNPFILYNKQDLQSTPKYIKQKKSSNIVAKQSRLSSRAEEAKSQRKSTQTEMELHFSHFLQPFGRDARFGLSSSFARDKKCFFFLFRIALQLGRLAQLYSYDVMYFLILLILATTTAGGGRERNGAQENTLKTVDK